MKRLQTLVGLGLIASIATAHWAMPDRDVPISRLLKNMEARLKSNPHDADAMHTMARLHSLAFATDTEVVDVYTRDPKRVWLPAWQTIQPVRTAGTPNKAALDHLSMAVKLYRTASEAPLNDWPKDWPERDKSRLGYAWTVEQAAPFFPKLAPGTFPASVRTPNDAKKHALSKYRELYAELAPKELSAPGELMGIADRYISIEAGEGILRLTKDPTIGSLGPGEKQSIEKLKHDLKLKSGPITPIVFSLNRASSFASWLSPKRSRFDLVGDGMPREFGWVAPRTAFLAWDPSHSGTIRSARQLFGSGTFWMEFGDGYRALSALDDNHDGWLTGRELAGIVVWVDRNSNGRCDPGEVVSLKSLGIVAIRVRADQTWRGMKSSSVGLVYADGSTAPTLDWVTAGVAATSPAAKMPK